MYLKLAFCIFLLLFPVAMVVAQQDGDGPGDTDAKMVSGMSILGNKEAPMSLFIVPWKTSELGAETKLTRTLDERGVPVDREVFLRELAFHEVSAGGRSLAPAAVAQSQSQ
jgi:hypothetical protein